MANVNDISKWKMGSDEKKAEEYQQHHCMSEKVRNLL